MLTCDHTKQHGFVCPSCGANLELSKREIESRDKMFEAFLGSYAKLKDDSEIKEKFKDFELTRRVFDGWLARNVATFSIMVAEMFVDKDDLKDTGKSKEENKTNLAKDKNLEERVSELEKRIEKLKSL